MRGLCRFLLILLATALPSLAGKTPEETAAAFYWQCAKVPLNVNAINALRSAGARERDRTMPPLQIQNRNAIWVAAGGQGNLARLDILSQRVVGDTASVTVILRYFGAIPPRQFTINLIRENGDWKVAD